MHWGCQSSAWLGLHHGNQMHVSCCRVSAAGEFLLQGFLAQGLSLGLSAGLGSVIIDSQPLTVALLASLFFGEALSGLGYAVSMSIMPN